MKYILVLIFLATSFISCKKEKTNPSICFNGKIKWAGNPAIDGLGWLIKDNLNNVIYKTKELNVAFKQDNLSVNVCLEKTDELFTCFCASPMPVYKITYINK